ncbi:MAG: ATP-grasp domain-containing protein [Candidatus Spechtbacteria bacterium]|nr:ATP-grasp domain-containing protein [Candidatus Spechtbacteria bacterium]
MMCDLHTLQKFFRDKVPTPIFGVDVYAFDRLGLEHIAPNYRLCALRDSLDTALIEKDIEVLSLERGMGTKHIQAPRNSTTVLSHPKTQAYLAQFENPAIIVYKSSLKMERLCEQKQWTLVASPVKFGKKLFEDKIKFRKILQEIGVTPPRGEILSARNLDFYKIKNKYGTPFVLQHPRRGGGKGTFFVSSQNDLLNAIRKLQIQNVEGKEVAENISNLEVIVAKYIHGPSCSITGCVTRHGILSTNPQYQLIDIPELYNPAKGSGLFCGHDWSSSRFSREIEQQAYDAVEKVGKYFQKLGYKGIFGIDFVLDGEKQKLYVTESNPRLLASFPTLTMVQIENNEPPIIAFHLLEYLNTDYEIDANQINALMRAPKTGAQMFLHNLTDSWVKNHAEVRAGVYRLWPGNTLCFVRPGYALHHLKDTNEFLLTDGVLPKKSHYSPNRRLCRIVTLTNVLGDDKKSLTPWARAVAKSVYDAFCLKKVRLAKIIKVFHPDFLAKG